jgi:Na+-transporting NADH:ubiquinone oxidoreductase subunit NqrB
MQTGEITWRDIFRGILAVFLFETLILMCSFAYSLVIYFDQIESYRDIFGAIQAGIIGAFPVMAAFAATIFCLLVIAKYTYRYLGRAK